MVSNTGVDREDAGEREERKRRQAELASLMVNMRALTHAGPLPGEYISLDPMIRFPAGVWNELAFHEQQWLRVEAAARTSRGAALAGRSAARRMGMWVVSPDAEPIELCLRSRGKPPSRASRPGYVYRRSVLRADEFRELDGTLMTTPFRTFVDIARYHGFAEGLIAADYLLYRGYTIDDLRERTERLGRLKGINTVRRCLEHAVDNSQSPYESYFRALLIDASLGTIQTQAPIAGYFADLLIDGWLVVEIDGAVKYAGPDAERVRQREFERQKVIGNLGYVFLRFTPEQIRRDPQGCVDQVRAALAARGRLIPGA